MVFQEAQLNREKYAKQKSISMDDLKRKANLIIKVSPTSENSNLTFDFVELCCSELAA